MKAFCFTKSGLRRTEAVQILTGGTVWDFEAGNRRMGLSVQQQKHYISVTFVTDTLVSVMTAYEERSSTERTTHPSAFSSLRGSIDLVEYFCGDFTLPFC